jgi:hypothetical protein
VTTNFVTRTRPTQAAIKFPQNCSFDTFQETCSWDTDYNNFKWFQTNGNSSDFFDMYGPGSDWTSISKLYN